MVYFNIVMDIILVFLFLITVNNFNNYYSIGLFNSPSEFTLTNVVIDNTSVKTLALHGFLLHNLAHT